MKSFRKFLIEDIDYDETNHIMSGKMPDGDATEHSFHAVIPSNTTPSGKTNLWVVKVSSDDGINHEFHFGINPTISPEVLKQRREQMSIQQNRQIAPHEAYYSFGAAEQDQGGLEYHGPETMFHVAHHFRNLFNDLPDGNKVTIHTGEEEMSDPDARNKKMKIYRMIVQRALRTGGGRILSGPDDSRIVIERNKES